MDLTFINTTLAAAKEFRFRGLSLFLVHLCFLAVEYEI